MATNKFFYFFRKLKTQKALNEPQLRGRDYEVTKTAKVVSKECVKEQLEALDQIDELYKNTFSALKDECDIVKNVVEDPQEKARMLKETEVQAKTLMDSKKAMKNAKTKEILKKHNPKPKVQTNGFYVVDKMVNTGAETTECGSGTDTVEKKIDESLISMNPYFNLRSLRKQLRSKRFVKLHEQLYYHLKHKFHMSVRNQTTYFQMRMEARNYMLKLGRSCNTAEDYSVFTGALDAAFLISEEEMRSREVIKDRRNLVQMKKVNQFNVGDLGNLNKPRGLTACLQKPTKVAFSDIPDIKY